MHFEVLVEDLSGKRMLEILLPKILGQKHTAKIINYSGVGHIPKDLHKQPDPRNRHLLNQLPTLLSG